MTVNILGTKYSIYYKSPSEDKFLRECDGYDIFTEDWRNTGER